MRKFTTLILAFGVTAILNGEIVDVRVDWDNVQCQKDCAKLLDKSFRRMNEVSEVSVDGANGVAVLKWKSDKKFTYYPVQAAFARVGITLNTLHLTVRGNVSHNGKEFYITSIGDGTKLHLLSTIHPGTTTPQPTDSPYNRPFTQEQKDKLLLAEKTKSVVTIKGPILKLDQLPPYDLITQSINISD